MRHFTHQNTVKNLTNCIKERVNLTNCIKESVNNLVGHIFLMVNYFSIKLLIFINKFVKICECLDKWFVTGGILLYR